MNSDEFFAKMEGDEQEWKSKPWYIRWPVDAFWWTWYRVIEWPSDIRGFYQSITRGYRDEDLYSLDDFIMRKVRKPLKAFVRYQEQHGMGLPNDFTSNPAGWLETLAKMEYSFDEAWKQEYEDHYATNKILKMPDEEQEAYYKKVSEGFELFGKYLRSLWD